MKKVILSLAILAICFGAAEAKDKKGGKAAAKSSTPAAPAAVATPAPAPVANANTASADVMKFKTEIHDFGTIQEGPTADYEFVFENTGSEPVVLDRVQASCGCTTPTHTKEPVLPNKSGTIKASYNTQGRPGPFTKTITVFSNKGTKVLTIKGTVEKGPEGSVPENNSMIKTH